MSLPGEKRARATLDDLHLVPVTMIRELINGTLYGFHYPGALVCAASSTVHYGLETRWKNRYGALGRWRFIADPDLLLGPPGQADLLVPDVAAWRIERMRRLKEEPIKLVPDWVCEVLSPDTEAVDRLAKVPAYARHGVKHLWIVDPRVRTLEVYGLDAGRWVELGRYSGDARVCAPPFENIELDLSDAWMDVDLLPPETPPPPPPPEEPAKATRTRAPAAAKQKKQQVRRSPEQSARARPKHSPAPRKPALLKGRTRKMAK